MKINKKHTGIVCKPGLLCVIGYYLNKIKNICCSDTKWKTCPVK